MVAREPLPSKILGWSSGEYASGCPLPSTGSGRTESNDGANAVRGEAQISGGDQTYILRPSFQALVAAEAELGSLFDLVEQAAGGRRLLSEIVALFWHCLADREDAVDRDHFGEEVARLGLAGITPALRIILKQIVAGRADP